MKSYTVSGIPIDLIGVRLRIPCARCEVNRELTMSENETKAPDADEPRRSPETFGISVPPETADRIEEQLEYGDSRSEWVRQAIDQRLSETGVDTVEQTVEDEDSELEVVVTVRR